MFTDEQLPELPVQEFDLHAGGGVVPAKINDSISSAIRSDSLIGMSSRLLILLLILVPQHRGVYNIETIPGHLKSVKECILYF